MLMSAYSARSEMMVVSAPGPAMSGKAIGTTVEPPPAGSFLKISTPRIISKAMMNSTMEPATANDWMSTPKSFNAASPRKKKMTKINREMSAAKRGLNLLPLCFSDRKMGIEPVMSMMAKSTRNAPTICTKSIMWYMFYGLKYLCNGLCRAVKGDGVANLFAFEGHVDRRLGTDGRKRKLCV